MTSSPSTHHSFDIELAAQYGVHEAILIHHFQHWINYNKRMGRNFKDGRTWSFQTRKEIAAWFPYLSEKQVRTITDNLIRLKVLRKGNYNKMHMDKTIWYCFENEKRFTTAHLGNSTAHSGNPIDEKGKAIPDTKTTESKLKIKENSVLPQKEEKKKDFSSCLNKQQRKAFEKITKHKPQWGEQVNRDDVCAWMLELSFSPERLTEAFAIYIQDCEKARGRGKKIDSKGKYIRYILNNPARKLEREDAKHNKEFAERKAAEHPRILEIMKQYVKVRKDKLAEELMYNIPHISFVTSLESLIRQAA